VTRLSDDWGVRLADVRAPRWWPFGAFVLLIAKLVRGEKDRRELERAVAAVSEVGRLLAERTVESDKRDMQMLDLTAEMKTMTQTLVFYGRVTMFVAGVSLVVALAALAVAIITA
jgi:hypothetical protein